MRAGVIGAVILAAASFPVASPEPSALIHAICFSVSSELSETLPDTPPATDCSYVFTSDLPKPRKPAGLSTCFSVSIIFG